MKNFIKELQWRGMLHDSMPTTEEHLMESMRSAYVGFDPTSDSLHIGNLVPIMLLAHFQRCGHKPIALVGGATGMIGDPSGKSSERNLLDEKTLRYNQEAIKGQLSHFLNFTSDAANAAVLVNNYDWMKDFSFLEFIRDVGKHISVNYMMAKDSVKNRIGSESKEGMSFTEFTYQLVQGYDFLHLFQNNNASIQMGGSDQWGNITTGTELIRRVGGGKGYAITCPLITKSDGTKFGKSEGGNVWLDAKRTSPYKFYQYWLNASDEDAENYIRIFTFLDKDGTAAYENAIKASTILFGKSTASDLKSLDEQTFLDVFDGVPKATVSLSDVEGGLDMIGALAAKTNFLASNGEARRALKENAISVNKEKVKEDFTISKEDLIANKYVLLQRGKKTYYLLVVA